MSEWRGFLLKADVQMEISEIRADVHGKASGVRPDVRLQVSGVRPCLHHVFASC